MTDIRVKDLTEATVPGADYYLLTDSATDGVKRVKTTNVVTPAAIGAASLAGIETLTNKTISGASNTLSAIPNDALTNSSVTVSGHTLSLGGTLNLAPADLGTAADSTILSNISGALASSSVNTIAAVMDKQLGAVQGSVAIRTNTGWASIGPGTSGQYLQTLGPAANPAWNTPAGSGDVVGPTSATDSGLVLFDGTTGKLIKNVPSAGLISGAIFDSVADLAAATVPAIVITVDTLGYYARGDGGGTRYVRVASAPSKPGYQPSNGGTVYWDLPDRSFINVKWLGAKGDGVTNDTTAFSNAFSAIVSAPTSGRGVLFIPTGTFVAKISVQDAHGFTIRGAGMTATTINPPSGDTSPVINCFSNVGSGSIYDFRLEDFSTGSSSTNRALPTIRIWNSLHWTLRHINCGGNITVQGSGNGVIDNVECYGGIDFGDGNGTLTNSGPITCIAGQFQDNNGGEAITVKGNILGLSFHATMYSSTAGIVSVRIDGPLTGTATGSVDFYQCHGESNMDATSSGIDFMIGENHKAGHVGIYGGNFWGVGDLTHRRLDWLRVVACRDLVIMSPVLSALGGTGYTGAGIRFASGYPAANDSYMINGVQADITGALFIDGAGVSHSEIGARFYPTPIDSTPGWAAYTPTVTAGTGTFTSVAAVGKYKIINQKTCLWRARIVITTNGTAANRVELTLPFTAADDVVFAAANKVSALACIGLVSSAINLGKVVIFTDTQTYPGGDGVSLIVGGSYEIA